MSLPLGYEASTFGLVCHLRKSLYGLSRASQNWYFKLSEILIEYDFIQSITLSSPSPKAHIYEGPCLC